MKKAVIILALLIAATSLYADTLFLHDNTTIKGEVTEFTPQTIKYKSEDGTPSEITKDLVEKIVYTGGRQVDFTDRIYLKDNSVLSGKVTGITPESVEYNPAGPLTIDTIKVADVVKIIYSNGKVEDFAAKNALNEIYLNDGRILKGKDIKIEERYIEFSSESGIKETYGIDIVDKIVYSSGEIRSFKKSEEPVNKEQKKEPEKPVTPPSGAFVEFEWGWNGYTGLGARFDYMVFDDFSINGGAGVGFWGYRLSAALRYYLNYPYGTAFSLGAAYNTGMSYESDYDTTDESGNIRTEKVTFKLKPVVCINATVSYSFLVNGKDKIYIEGGYSYAIQDKKYTYETESNKTLTEESEDIMELMAPGGVIFSIGYAFML